MIPFGDDASLGAPKLLSRSDLVEIILKLEFEGWQVAVANDANLTNAVSEPYMNGRLFQGMVSVRNALGLTNVYLVETPGLRVSPASAVPERAPDAILLFAEFGSNEPHAIIECKRVDPTETSRSLRGEYVREGIDRFVTAAYGRDHDLGFMVGYLLQSDGAAAASDINAYLANVGRASCALRPSIVYNRLGYVAESDHARSTDGTMFRLLHSFVAFPGPGALRAARTAIHT
jgi:hypothetical protein